MSAINIDRKAKSALSTVQRQKRALHDLQERKSANGGSAYTLRGAPRCKCVLEAEIKPTGREGAAGATREAAHRPCIAGGAMPCNAIAMRCNRSNQGSGTQAMQRREQSIR
eukprot:1002923-Pelagomonas_calceolata.AAC.2